MPSLAGTLQGRDVPSGHLALYWLCQAGFAFKSAAGEVVLIDPYCSDVVERIVGFKRMMPCPIRAEEVNPDLVVFTHEHLDHLDIDAVPILARNPKTKFAGPIECMKELEKLKVPSSQCYLLEEGRSEKIGDTLIHAVYADHGELAPDALGIILDFDGIKVYHTGETAYRPVEFQPAADFKPDILIPCINGKFGNMDAHEAALCTGLVQPAVVIPCHFWMFIEQNGDPETFVRECKETVAQTRTVLITPGEEFLYQKPS
jgi:L-ascorbate 6-phosphate lactonase